MTDITAERIEELRKAARDPIEKWSDGRLFTRIDCVHLDALLSELERLRAALETIRDHYAAVGVSHVDFRVHAYATCLEALDPPAPPSVEEKR